MEFGVVTFKFSTRSSPPSDTTNAFELVKIRKLVLRNIFAFQPFRCQECMDEWDDNNGFYKVKNKTACGSDLKSKILGRASSARECAQKCRCVCVCVCACVRVHVCARVFHERMHAQV